MSYAGQSHHPHTVGTAPNSTSLLPIYASLPPHLELVQAHWFIRHGERTPVRKRLTSAGVPSVFSLCAAGKQFGTSVLQTRPLVSSTLVEGETAEIETKAFEGDLEGGRAFFDGVNGATVGGGNGQNQANGGADVEQGRLEVRRLTEEQGAGNNSIPGGAADCYWGELTDMGRTSTLFLGGQLRKLYVESGFLPAKLPNLPLEESPVAFRSTGMPRTIESLHQVVAGLFPAGKRDGPVDYVVRTPDAESLYPNSQCLRMRKIDREYAARAAELYNHTLAPLDATIGKYIEGPIRIDGNPRANGILDTTMVCRAHGIPMPNEFQDLKALRILESAVVHEWFDAYASPEFKRLSMGRLLGDLKSTLERKVSDPLEKTEKLRLAINACHDTSLSGILNALDAFDNRWPPFTSYISFELLRSPRTSINTDKEKEKGTGSFLRSFVPSFLGDRWGAKEEEKEHYVRVLYNSKPVKIPACREVGNHLEGSDGEICTWDAFKDAVRDVEITAKEWERECNKKD